MDNPTAGNFSVKFIEQVLGDQNHWIRREESALWKDVIARFRRATHFALPLNGEILPRPASLLDYPDYPDDPLVYAPPFDDLVLEWYSDRLAANGVGRASTRTLVLVSRVEWLDDQYVRLIFIRHRDSKSHWVPSPRAIFIRIGAATGECDQAPFRIAKDHGLAEGNVPLYMSPWLPVTQDRLNKIAEKQGLNSDELLRDWLCEAHVVVQSYIELCQALSCSNVSTTDIPASKALNSDRARRGRQRLFDYKVLTVTTASGSSSAGAGGTGTPVRSHLRRGHIRRCASGVRVWVNACMVNGGADGFVLKDYSIARRAA